MKMTTMTVSYFSNYCFKVQWFYTRICAFFIVLEYWAKHQHRFPNIHSLARKILAIPAWNCEVERLFSSSKMTMTDCRTRLAADKLNKITFLRKNLQALKQLDEKKEEFENGPKRKLIDEDESKNEHEQQTPSSTHKKHRIGNDSAQSGDELDD